MKIFYIFIALICVETLFAIGVTEIVPVNDVQLLSSDYLTDRPPGIMENRSSVDEYENGELKRSYIEEIYNYSENGLEMVHRVYGGSSQEIIRETTVGYNENGQQLYIHQTLPNFYRQEFSYNRQGLISAIYELDNGRRKIIYHFIYDEQGRLIEEYDFKGGIGHGRNSFIYGDHGVIRAEHRLGDINNPLSNYWFNKMEYESEGRLHRISFFEYYDGQISRVGHRDLEYDPVGNARMISVVDMNGIETNRQEFVYQNGMLIEEYHKFYVTPPGVINPYNIFNEEDGYWTEVWTFTDGAISRTLTVYSETQELEVIGRSIIIEDRTDPQRVLQTHYSENGRGSDSYELEGHRLPLDYQVTEIYDDQENMIEKIYTRFYADGENYELKTIYHNEQSFYSELE